MTLVKFSNGRGNQPALESSFSFPSFFSDTLERLWTDEAVSWMPSVNIRERAEDFIIDLAVPGMNKKDFSVEVDNGVLTVRGERKEESSEENEKVTRREFQYGSFVRTFNLPESADPEKIKAAYKDGILNLTISKKEEAKPKPRKQIDIE